MEREKDRLVGRGKMTVTVREETKIRTEAQRGIRKLRYLDVFGLLEILF